MSEEGDTHFYRRIATQKNREIVRNIALGAWLIGVVLSILAVVFLKGTEVVFACLVTVNIVFLILNLGFCRVNLHTLKKRRIFCTICLILMIANVAVLAGVLIQTPDDIFQIIGFVGCGLLSISCIALVSLNILLNIHGLQDPSSNGTEVQPQLPEDLTNGYFDVRYVSMRRGRQNDDSTFQIVPGQILSLPHPSDAVTNTGQCERQPATNNTPTFNSGFRERTRRQSQPNFEGSIRTISDGMFSSQRRDSSISLISLIRRTSVESVEYDTASVRCTCFYLAIDTSDEDEVPPYSENPTGNVSRCPIHGENTILPPSYEQEISAYNALCKVLGLPMYDDVVSSVAKLAAEKSTVTTPFAAPMRRTSTAPAFFETIVEDGSETAISALPGDISQEPTDTTTGVQSTMATAESSVGTEDEAPTFINSEQATETTT